MTRFSLTRLRALITKEVIQMKRDRITLAMLPGLPLMQLMRASAQAAAATNRNLRGAETSLEDVFSQLTREAQDSIA